MRRKRRKGREREVEKEEKDEKRERSGEEREGGFSSAAVGVFVAALCDGVFWD